MANRIGVGLIGCGFIGKAHAHACRQVGPYFHPDLIPECRVICDQDEELARQSAEQWGWFSYCADWRELLDDPDIGLIGIAAPNYTHKEIALAATKAGKHIICEKPLANTLTDAQQMLEAVQRAGVTHMIVFNYRFLPAIQLAKQIIDSGQLGDIRHFRALYLQDWLVNPNHPMTWRLRRDTAGSGALGDIGAHIVDLARFLVGEIVEVIGVTSTFIEQRPMSRPSPGEVPMLERVTVDDATLFLARFENGVVGSFEASRLATGHRNRQEIEINGSLGSVRFNLEELNELQFFSQREEGYLQGFRTIHAYQPDHPYASAWWPPGHEMGWADAFVHVYYEMLQGVAHGHQPTPSFADGVRCQAILHSVIESAVKRSWVPVA